MAPSIPEAALLYAGMQWKRLRRGRLLWVCLALVLVPVVGAAGLAAGGNWGRGLFDDVMSLYFRFLLPFVPAVLASPVVAEELESKTFTYLFARPAPKSSLVLGKFLVVTFPVALLVAVSVAIVWLLAMARFPSDMADNFGHLVLCEAAALLGTFTYAALASCIGSMFSGHPFIAASVYLLAVEAGLGSAPIVLNLAAMSWHLRNLSGLLAAQDPGLVAIDVPAYASAIVCAAVTGLGLLGAILFVDSAEYHGR